MNVFAGDQGTSNTGHGTPVLSDAFVWTWKGIGAGQRRGKGEKERDKRMACFFLSVILSLCMHVVVLEEVTAADL